MNQINPKKLLNSKWTSVSPKNKEKHFMVTEVEFNESGEVVLCTIEAVMTSRAFSINWHGLKEGHSWVQGWK